MMQHVPVDVVFVVENHVGWFYMLQIQPLITKITNSQNTKRTCGQASEQHFPKGGGGGVGEGAQQPKPG